MPHEADHPNGVMEPDDDLDAIAEPCNLCLAKDQHLWKQESG